MCHIVFPFQVANIKILYYNFTEVPGGYPSHLNQHNH